MNKKILLSSLAILTMVLSGCGGKKNSSSSSEQPDQPIPEQFEIDIRATETKMGLLVGEERAINIFPDFKGNFQLKYTSLNPEIATVDENGKVTAVSQGVAKIAVQDLSRQKAGVFVEVQVVEKQKKTASKKTFQAIMEGAASIVIDNFTDREYYEKTIYKNGVAQKYGFWDQQMTYSKEHAYFGIVEQDIDYNVEGGSKYFTDTEWVFYTNEYYDSYTFHTAHGQKNYYVASTADYIGQPRTAPMYDILDNIFVSGSQIFTQMFTQLDVADEDNLYSLLFGATEYTNCKISDQRMGSLGEGKAICGVTMDFFSDTASQDDETRYGIPYGIATPSIQKMEYVIEDNRITAYYVQVSTTYSFGGDDYEEVVNICHTVKPFTEGNPELRIPNKDDYTLVGYLFAI